MVSLVGGEPGRQNTRKLRKKFLRRLWIAVIPLRYPVDRAHNSVACHADIAFVDAAIRNSRLKNRLKSHTVFARHLEDLVEPPLLEAFRAWKRRSKLAGKGGK